eukprot:3616861-Lingulodinium_polyedra.AAC.1
MGIQPGVALLSPTASLNSSCSASEPTAAWRQGPPVLHPPSAPAGSWPHCPCTIAKGVERLAAGISSNRSAAASAPHGCTRTGGSR